MIKSKCCNALTDTRGDCGGHGEDCDSLHTVHEQCRSCLKPCDLQSEEEEEEEEEQRERLWREKGIKNGWINS